MKAIVTVIGKDVVGIIATVSTECAGRNANVVEVTQSVLQDVFVMVMLVDITNLNCEFAEFSNHMSKLGENMGLKISAMHENIFNSMHRI